MAATKKHEEVVEKVVDKKRADFSATLFMVNPFHQKDRFYPGEITKDVLIDNWVLSQEAAGLLTRV